MIRASNNDCECRNGSLQTRGDTHSAARNRREQHDMHHVRSPVSEKRSNAPKRCPPADNDIHIGRQRHPHRPMRMDRGKQKSPRESRREASNKQLFFVPAKAGLFERPKAAFFTVAAAVVMHRMMVGMGRRHGGKLFFRRSAPPATPRRSRQPPPRLFVFMSTYYRSIY